MDNSATCQCEQIKQICEKWDVTHPFGCVNQENGNSIVKKNNRTIKRMAARKKWLIQEIVSSPLRKTGLTKNHGVHNC